MSDSPVSIPEDSPAVAALAREMAQDDRWFQLPPGPLPVDVGDPARPDYDEE